ncbi:haloalkane dehalogenase [Streptomyces ipomoeae]|uniref:Hydrolase, alpha/beta domain protein n=2 Tax=Streptomyces ipomoeae TaxID=103232 RepID=L1KJR6_9ACTN|nr:haloalkane dehalogenase [Streptomyces ipomoeae]EKX60725.1 hydrolase, alpha/beta domain protein [Streptomyces ipomoeae 91-03]MDX2693207.1 haloalkane dehalogenase [Streptomyces ipomoeae]MDX2820650.1 haloalkane dehalogenase [Streptomyces ipomoeae]MDX2838681.1 haloalkane dehalogenase [Streptomyces ipomoeae]MDX2873158.1 haloalkane dehalogenase [Streptomyces ipomoeae]
MPEIAALGSTMHYLDDGEGVPLVFLHGNCASSYVWRNVLPYVGGGRLLAPDLIGMGRSGKPDIPYLFADHARYLDAWTEALRLDRVVLVGHDWGGTLACDWAARHPERVHGVVLLESIIKPMTWDELGPMARARCEAINTPGVGEEMVLRQDLYLRQAYTGGGGVLTTVADDDMNAHLAPHPTPDSRRPLLAWARQIPLDGQPAELVARMRAFNAWLKASPDVPKLLLTFQGSPTLLVDEAMSSWCAANIAALETVPCGTAGHFAPEDRPREIAAAISSWIGRHRLLETPHGEGARRLP